MTKLTIEGIDIAITNPEKYLWKKQGITKVEYLKKLIFLSEFLIKHAQDRLLTTIRYPDGIEGKFFYQKNIPGYAPKWIETFLDYDTNYILLKDLPVLVWLGNQAAIEYHISFNTIKNKTNPLHLIFDLDPSEGQEFSEVVEVALIVYNTLKGLGIESYVKTSGASGLQIYIPVNGQYDYETARKINAFFGEYFSTKYPNKITIERFVEKRGKKLYFDYLQMWEGKTIIAPYSPRAKEEATVAVPLQWSELEKEIKPSDFTLLNIEERIREKGDLFEELLEPSKAQDLGPIIDYIDK